MNKEQIEEKILEAISLEKTNLEISKELKMSIKNVEKRIKSLFHAFKVKSRAGLVREYMKEKYSRIFFHEEL